MNNDILIQELEKTQVIEKVVHSLMNSEEKCRSNDNYLFGRAKGTVYRMLSQYIEKSHK